MPRLHPWFPIPYPSLRHPLKVPPPAEILWSIIGLILTIAGTLLEAYIPGWGQQGLQAYSLGVTCQIGAVLLVGCLGGRNAAAIAQVAYLLLGLSSWSNVFSQGGGLEYVLNPRFGYLLGFIPGAWVCGWLAFRFPAKLEYLALSCLAGLACIHALGMTYLTTANSLNWSVAGASSLGQSFLDYSLLPLPGHLAVVCAVTVVSYALRHVMFY